MSGRVFVCQHCHQVYFEKGALALSGVIVTPDHGPGRKGQAAWNTLDEAETAAAVQFIQNYGDVYGLPQPAAPRGHNGPSPIYLPCFTTRKMVHGLDQQAEGAMSYRSFTRVWSKVCADVVIMKPREDVCSKYSDLRSQISRALNEEPAGLSTAASSLEAELQPAP